MAQTKTIRETEGREVKTLLGAAVLAHAPTPPASARVHEKAPNSAAAAEQMDWFKESVGGNPNLTNDAGVEG